MLGCLTWDGLDRYPDETRQRAEWGMALLSLGAAVENLMLTAADAGLASCWVAAPIFCPEAARDALRLAERMAPPRARAGRAIPIPPTSPASAPPVPLDDTAPRISRVAQRAAGELALEVLEGARDALFELGPRLPAEVDPGPARVERAALHLTGAGRVVARVLLEAGELRHHVEELLHARLDAGADVHQQPAALVDRAHERVDDVVDVHEVAGLRAVAEDHGPFVASSNLPAKIDTTPASPCGSWRGP